MSMKSISGGCGSSELRADARLALLSKLQYKNANLKRAASLPACFIGNDKYQAIS